MGGSDGEEALRAAARRRGRGDDTERGMKWALITGAGKRIGRAVALGLAREGWSVAIHYNSSRDEAEAVAEEARAHGVSAAIFQAELSDESKLAPLVAAAQKAAGGKLVGLVNTAAAFVFDDINSLTSDNLKKHMDVNALAPALLAREFAKSLPED